MSDSVQVNAMFTRGVAATTVVRPCGYTRASRVPTAPRGAN